ncbi:MAG TPA: MerR family transcriptional regulator [Microlunatus sp.]|nr:MerR family transcriptional regulator [Microlunatus sp.]
MRMSELSRVSGVPVATIKFYLRAGLLPEGVRSSPNQAQYDDSHLQRLRLIRALVGAGGLSLAAVRTVLHQIDEPTGLTLDLLGAAHRAVAPEVADDLELDDALDLLRRWGWKACLTATGPRDGARAQDAGPAADDAVAALASALGALRDAGFEIEPSTLDTYADAMMDVAAAEIDGIPVTSPSAAVRYVVLGTVLVEPVLLALRRLAQREASAARFPVPG